METRTAEDVLAAKADALVGGDDVVHQPKWKIALDEVDRLIDSGLRFGDVLADAGFLYDEATDGSRVLVDAVTNPTLATKRMRAARATSIAGDKRPLAIWMSRSSAMTPLPTDALFHGADVARSDDTSSAELSDFESHPLRQTLHASFGIAAAAKDRLR